MKKRRHHYVWRNYLKSWSTSNKIWCHREGKIFNPNTMGIGQKRDFYEVNELSANDREVIQKYFIRPTYSHLQKANSEWVELFSWIHNVKKKIVEADIKNTDVDNFISEIVHNFEENLHEIIEKNSKKYLDSILKEDLSFFKTKSGCINFSHYLAVQLMRTEKVKSDIVHRMDTMKNRDPDYNIRKIWNVVSHILSTNMAWSIYASTRSEKPYKIILLKNESSKELITGDQPVINIYNESNDKSPEQTELYYPVSPRLAVLVSQNEYYLSHEEVILNEGQVKYYNRMIVMNSKNQVYASTKGTLLEYFE